MTEQPPMPTIKDLENAREELQNWEDRFDRYSGNNPDKYQADIRTARRRVREIEETLKASGEMPRSNIERLNAELDRAFPNAKNKEIVEYQGQRYQRRFYPLERSRSRKKVTEWGRAWVELKDGEV